MKEQQLEKEKKSKQSFFGRLFGTGGGTTPSGQVQSSKILLTTSPVLFL